jgi:hypothetical protein
MAHLYPRAHHWPARLDLWPCRARPGGRIISLMGQHVGVRAELRWPAPMVQRVAADEPEVLFGARHRPLEEPSSFPAEMRVPLGRHGAVSCAASLRIGPVTDGARAVTITPVTKRWLFPSLDGTLAVAPRDGTCALVLSGTARVPYGLLVHRRWGRQALEQSLRGMTERLAANVDRHLDLRSRKDARRALLPIGSPERRASWGPTE